MNEKACSYCDEKGVVDCITCGGKGKIGGFLGIGGKACPSCHKTGMEPCPECGKQDATGTNANLEQEIGEARGKRLSWEKQWMPKIQDVPKQLTDGYWVIRVNLLDIYDGSHPLLRSKQSCFVCGNPQVHPINITGVYHSDTEILSKVVFEPQMSASS